MSLLYCFMRKLYVGALINEATVRKSCILDLASEDVEEIPAELFHHGDLRKLFLGQNRLVEVPVNIRIWQNLTVLSLDYNKIGSLPDEISELKALVYLNVSHNPLGKLPARIGKIASLEALWCNCVDIDRLPDEICELPNLRTLGARKNNIKSLPENFEKLTKLSWLTLQNNSLEELPEGLGKMELIHVNVSMNSLRELPRDITTYKSLQYFIANDNQISCLPLLESTRWDLSGMTSLIYIDLRNNPIEEDSNFKEYFQSYTQIKSSLNDFDMDHRDNTAENQQQNNRINPDSGNNNQEINNDVQDNADEDSDTSSYEDWEHSVSSSQLNFEEQSDDEMEEDEIRGIDLPVVSRFAGTGS